MSRDLREARERAGLSVEEASKRTRIPQRYLEALERGDHSVFPPGPFLSGYTKQYRGFLGLPERPPPPEPTPLRPAPLPSPAPAPAAAPPKRPDPADELTEAVRRAPQDELTETTATVRRNWARLALVGAAVVAGIAILIKVAAGAFPAVSETLGEKPDQQVTLALDEEMRVRVIADGRVVADGPLAPTTNTPHVFGAHDKLEIDLPTLDGVRLRYNGEPLTPLGAQARPRRLVFVDDGS